MILFLSIICYLILGIAYTLISLKYGFSVLDNITIRKRRTWSVIARMFEDDLPRILFLSLVWIPSVVFTIWLGIIIIVALLIETSGSGISFVGSKLCYKLHDLYDKKNDNAE